MEALFCFYIGVRNFTTRDFFFLSLSFELQPKFSLFVLGRKGEKDEVEDKYDLGR